MDRKTLIKDLLKAGQSYRKIGKLLNISGQRVYQMAKPEKYREIKKRYTDKIKSNNKTK